MSNAIFVEKLMTRRRQISIEIEALQRNADGVVPLSASLRLRKERKAIEEAIARCERKVIDHG